MKYIIILVFACCFEEYLIWHVSIHSGYHLSQIINGWDAIAVTTFPIFIILLILLVAMVHLLSLSDNKISQLKAEISNLKERKSKVEYLNKILKEEELHDIIEIVTFELEKARKKPSGIQQQIIEFSAVSVPHNLNSLDC